ncbi:MAG: hypothetical protein COY40_03205 [Alphaproteobacteria bacterium CG_4_10_14_0_8_um_filter_53_9]|nr:MAG: hypothetical protein COY40_03205 [Alphaproteobacteria bacterium CG_4_10_14_0_8_um_filter_53_9]
MILSLLTGTALLYYGGTLICLICLWGALREDPPSPAPPLKPKNAPPPKGGAFLQPTPCLSRKHSVYKIQIAAP